MIYDLKDRSRKDLIETVNIQAEEYKKLLAENKELEKECEELYAFKIIFGMGDGESVVTARQYINSLKLEQQAKGIEDFVNSYCGNRMDFSQAERLIVNLRTQSKQLREGVQP